MSLARRAKLFGLRHRCPVCGWRLRRFADIPSRPQAECPGCGSRERHRLLWLYLARHTNLFEDRLRVLHVSPEPGLRARLEAMASLDYTATELGGGPGMVAADLTTLPFPDAAFDVVLCSHVLEHVADDRAAMRELRRVLAGGGWGVLQVPLLAERTTEDPSVVEPAARQALYGQPDHVRVYGRDYLDRLRNAGFAVTVHSMRDELSARDVERLGLAHRIAAMDTEAPAFWEIYRVSG